MRALAPFLLLVCCSVPAFPDTWIYTFADQIGFPSFNVGFSFETSTPLNLTRTEYGPHTPTLLLTANQMTSSLTKPGDTVAWAQMWWEAEPGIVPAQDGYPAYSFPGYFRVDFNYGSGGDNADFVMPDLQQTGSYTYEVTDQAGFSVQDIPDARNDSNALFLAPAPEPSSWVLASLGLLLMAGFVRWIRRQASAETVASLKTIVTRA